MATPGTVSSASAPRTRTGCWACRDRGIKCDEHRPRCRKCARLGLLCQYGIRLQWIEDSKERGVCHGRQGVWSSSKRKLKPGTENRELQKSQTASSLASSQPRPQDAAPFPRIFFLNTSVDDMDTYMTGTSDGDEYLDFTENQLVDNQTIKQRQNRYANALCAARSEPCVRADFGRLIPRRSRLFDSTFATLCLERPLDALDGNILQYYDGVIARKAVILDDEDCNPFRYLILPMALTSSTILSAILVISATKLSHIDNTYQARALIHRQRLFSDLAKRLQTIKSDTSSFSDALVSVVILCWADITDHCRPSWLSHMMGISGILDSGPIELCDDPSIAKLLRFCRQYLLYHLVMARATFRVDKLLPGWKPALTPLLEDFQAPSPPISPVIMPSRITGCRMDWMPSPPPCPPKSLLRRSQSVGEVDDPDEIDAHQGFSNSLLLIINDICDLAQKSRFDGMDADFQNMHRLHELLQKVNKLCRRIENIIQTPPKSLQRGSRPNAWGLLDPCIDDDEWRRLRQQEQLLGVVTATAEANRLGCLLFLDDICAHRFPGIIPSCRSDRAKNIENIIDLAEKICAYGSITAALPIWPVFMAACAVNGEQDRIRVSSLLDTYRSGQTFGTIPPTCAVIESVWRQHDLACGEKQPTQRVRSNRQVSVSTRGAIRDGKGRGVDKLRKGVVDERYPWERAMLILKGPVLSLT